LFYLCLSNCLPISIKRAITSHLNSLNKKGQQRHMTLEIQVLAWDRHNVVGTKNIITDA
jgi:hypothetical protein